MDTIDFALGELKCGRLPWLAGWAWVIIIAFVVSFIAGYGANLYVLDIANANLGK